jgi:hypothetical protein
LIIYIIIAHYVDLREPLNKEKVFLAIQRGITEKTIKRITLVKGGIAGDIGYYFIEFEPEGYRVVINDARFSLYDKTLRYRKTVNMGSPITLLGHVYEHQIYPLSYQSTSLLKIRSLFNLIFCIKTKEQLFWDTL